MRPLIPLFMIGVSCTACTQASDASGKSQGNLMQQRRATLDRIAAECDLPASTFKMAASDEIRMRPPPDARYESVDCALGKFRESDVPMNTLGFVGNEAFRPEPANAPSN